MSFTDTDKHWLWGCAAATAASRSDVNVAMPHLRGKWSPTNAILRTLECSFMTPSFEVTVASRIPLPNLLLSRSLRSVELPSAGYIHEVAEVEAAQRA